MSDDSYVIQKVEWFQFRDPDGHRIELGLPPIQYMDAEELPNAWDSTQGASLIPLAP